MDIKCVVCGEPWDSYGVEELADLFTVRKVSNPDGSPRYMIEAA